MEEAKRFLHGRLAEHPSARAARVATADITVAEALKLHEADAADHGQSVHDGRVHALRHALIDVKLKQLTRALLDELCRRWRSVGIEYPERNVKVHRLHPVSGATCNRMMATLRRARTLAMDKLNVELPG